MRRVVISAFQIAVGVVIALCVLFMLCEIGMRVYLASAKPAQAAISRPAVYADSPYWSPEFERDKAAAQKAFSGEIDAPNTTYHGPFYNIVNGQRSTTDQPTNAPHTLWLFGSSTIFNMEVPDGYTVASYLQRIVGSAYRVENMGMWGLNADQEFERIQQAPIAPGDVVVMYDGINEATSFTRVLANRRRANSFCRAVLRVIPWSIIIRAACENEDLAPVGVDYAMIQESFLNYAQTVTVAHDYVTSKGAAFYHFLQPSISTPKPTGYEVELAGNDPSVYDATWPLFRYTPHSIDLTHALDEVRKSGKVIFFDGAHLNELGNKAIASAIYDAIFGEF